MTTSTKPVSSANPWFGVSMILIGVVAGYSLANVNAARTPPEAAPAAQVAPTPDPTPAPTPPPAPSAKNVKAVDSKVDHIRGDSDAEISVIEYSDFECPFCKRHHPTMQKIVDEYNGKVNWVFRHYPLGFHANAQKAAEATECANEQGSNDKFWKMADMIFEKGANNDNLASYAKDIGLDEDDFKDCLDSGKYAQHVKDDMASGSAAGVSGTPGTIVLHNKTEESKLVSGAQSFSNFKTAIDSMLK